MKEKNALSGILAEGDPPAFRIENQNSRSSFLILCDHASNKVPKALEKLGLSESDLGKHIAWDIGAEKLSLIIAKALDATCFLAGYSRLVVDLNRDPKHAGSILEVSDHVCVPGNQSMTKTERLARLDALYHPYHDEIDRKTARIAAAGKPPVVIAIHSFTPEMNGQKRPWHIGILWNRDERVALPLIEMLRSDNPELVIGDNQPYSAKEGPEFNNTIERHAESRGLPSVMVEFRQDMVNTAAGAQKMAQIFLRALAKIDVKTFS